MIAITIRINTRSKSFCRVGVSCKTIRANGQGFSETERLSNSPFFLPYLSGERPPHNDPHIRGSFHSIKKTTDATNIQYSVIEGVSFGILDGVNSILKVNNRSINSLSDIKKIIDEDLLKAGDKIKLLILRDDIKIDINLLLEKGSF